MKESVHIVGRPVAWTDFAGCQRSNMFFRLMDPILCTLLFVPFIFDSFTASSSCFSSSLRDISCRRIQDLEHYRKTRLKLRRPSSSTKIAIEQQTSLKMHHLLFLLAALLHLAIAIPTPQCETCDEVPQKSCATNARNMPYKKEFNEGFCAPFYNRGALGPFEGPADWYDDIIALDFNFDFKSNICGYHVYLDLGCTVCARSTLNRTNAKAGADGTACLSLINNGGYWAAIKAAPCDGTGLGCWNGGVMEHGDQGELDGM